MDEIQRQARYTPSLSTVSGYLAKFAAIHVTGNSRCSKNDERSKRRDQSKCSVTDATTDAIKCLIPSKRGGSSKRSKQNERSKRVVNDNRHQGCGMMGTVAVIQGIPLIDGHIMEAERIAKSKGVTIMGCWNTTWASRNKKGS